MLNVIVLGMGLIPFLYFYVTDLRNKPCSFSLMWMFAQMIILPVEGVTCFCGWCTTAMKLVFILGQLSVYATFFLGAIHVRPYKTTRGEIRITGLNRLYLGIVLGTETIISLLLVRWLIDQTPDEHMLLAFLTSVFIVTFYFATWLSAIYEGADMMKKRLEMIVGKQKTVVTAPVPAAPRNNNPTLRRKEEAIFKA